MEVSKKLLIEYGSSTSKEYRQGALVDNDRIWEAKLDDFVLPKVEKCEETSAQLSCLDASVVERFYSFNNENLLSKKIVPDDLIESKK